MDKKFLILMIPLYGIVLFPVLQNKSVSALVSLNSVFLSIKKCIKKFPPRIVCFLHFKKKKRFGKSTRSKYMEFCFKDLQAGKSIVNYKVNLCITSVLEQIILLKGQLCININRCNKQSSIFRNLLSFPPLFFFFSFIPHQKEKKNKSQLVFGQADFSLCFVKHEKV